MHQIPGIITATVLTITAAWMVARTFVRKLAAPGKSRAGEGRARPGAADTHTQSHGSHLHSSDGV